jgi:lysophospholipase L1-like esterase
MMKELRLVLASLAICFAGTTAAQETPFQKEIDQFKKQDSIQMPPKKAILFTGSSSFRVWPGLQDSFPNKTIINRAFGGSSLPHLILYATDVILAYQPKQILIYCGDNDLASSDTVQAVHVLQRFQQLFNIIRNRYPKVHIAFVSIKPSPSREKLVPKMEEANKLIESYLKTKRRTAFIDVYHPMLLSNGKADPTLFIQDNLHMNAKGYAIWTRIIKPYLKN